MILRNILISFMSTVMAGYFGFTDQLGLYWFAMLYMLTFVSVPAYIFFRIILPKA